MSIADHQRIIIASKHLSLVTWLAQEHPEIAQRAIYDPGIRAHSVPPNSALIGSWPAHIVHAADAYYTVEFRRRPTKPDLSASEMIEHGAYLKQWHLLDADELQRVRDEAVDAYRATTEPQ